MAELSLRDLPRFSDSSTEQVTPTSAVLVYRWPGRNRFGEANAVGEVLQAESLGAISLSDGEEYAVLRVRGDLPRQAAKTENGWGSPCEPTANWELSSDVSPRDKPGVARYLLTPTNAANYDIVPQYHVVFNPDGTLNRIEGRTTNGCQVDTLDDGLQVWQTVECNATVERKNGKCSWRDGNTAQLLARTGHPDYWNGQEMAAAVTAAIQHLEPSLRKGLVPGEPLARDVARQAAALPSSAFDRAKEVPFRLQTATRNADRTPRNGGQLRVPPSRLTLRDAPLAIRLDQIEQQLANRADTGPERAAAVIARAKEFLLKGAWADEPASPPGRLPPRNRPQAADRQGPDRPNSPGSGQRM